MPARGALHTYAAWLLALLYMGAIFYLIAQSTVPIPLRFPQQDKVMHAGAYALLGLLLAHAIYPGSRKRRFILAFTLAALYGVSDEIHQLFVPGRDASVFDWLADAAGAWLGAFLYLRSKKSPGSGN